MPGLDRLTSVSADPLCDRAYTYDLLGRPLTAGFVTCGETVTNAFDALGRLTSASSNAGGTAHALSYLYDLADRRTRVTWWDGFTVDYDRLVTGEVSKARENGATTGVGVLATYAYDNLGNRLSLTFGNGVVQNYTYDPVSRLASLSNDLPGGSTNDLTIGTPAAPITYNPASQITSVVRTGDAYAFTPISSGTTNSTANGLNQQIAIGGSTATWDNLGNLTSDPTSGNTYTYGLENKLTSAVAGGVTRTLSYDPLNRLDRYNPGTATRFVYDGLDAAAEIDTSGAIQHRYVSGDGADELLLDYVGSGTTSRRFLSTDERGSVISLTDSSGALIAINTYDEYGKPGAANTGRFQYTGQKWLSEIGAYDYKARVYLPHLGIFAQTDPVGQQDSPSLYAYVLNDPVNLVDPLGLDANLTNIGDVVIIACANGGTWPWCLPALTQLDLTSGDMGGGGAIEPGSRGQGDEIVITGNRRQNNTCLSNVGSFVTTHMSDAAVIANSIGDSVTASEVLAVAGNETHYGGGFARIGNYFGIHGSGPAGTYYTSGNHTAVAMFPPAYGFLMSGLAFARNVGPYMTPGIGDRPFNFFRVLNAHGYATGNSSYPSYMVSTGATRGPYTLVTGCTGSR